MKLYRILPDDKNWGRQHSYKISATRHLNLPGVHCSVCGNTWARTGVLYPSVDWQCLTNTKEWPWKSVVSEIEFKHIARFVHGVIGDRYPLSPGAEFGPLKGRITGGGGKAAFMWQNPWTPLVCLSTYNDMKVRFGNAVTGVLSKIEYKSMNANYVELEAIPNLDVLNSIAAGTPIPPCTGCGRVAISIPQKIVVDGGNLEDNVSIFRLRYFPTVVLVSEEFAGYIKGNKFNNILFYQVEIA